MALAQSQPQVIVQESKELKEIIARLNERLDEPFVTAGTVTGDKGIKQAQDEYQRLMNNKIVIQRAQCHACMSIAERERFIKISEIQKKMSV